jgi:glycosyltransferase involved in cell wall biosynthesis
MRLGIDVRAMQVGGGSAHRGIGRYLTDLVASVVACSSDHDVILVGREGFPIVEELAALGLEYVPVGGPIWHDARRPLHLRIPKLRSNPRLLQRDHDRAVRAQREALEGAVARARLDVFHLPTALDVGSYPEGDFACPTVMTVLDTIPLELPQWHYDTWAPFLKGFYRRQLENLGKAAVVVAISECSRRDGARHSGVPEERIRVVYPAVGGAFREPPSAEEEATAERYGIDRPYFLFVSVPDPWKNAPRLVEAFAAAGLGADHRLVLVSPLDHPHVPELRRTAAASGLGQEAFGITGRVPERDLVALFRSARAVVVPSLYEGFGLPAAQAMAVGTPVAVSDRASLPEVVGDAGLKFDPERPEEIAEALVRLARDARLRATLSERGHERAERFVPDRQGREMWDLYEEAAQAGRA